MPDAEAAVLLRSVLDELCAQVSKFDATTRANVASRLLEAAKQEGPRSMTSRRQARKHCDKRRRCGVREKTE
jgi:hypothetical protein